GCARRCRALHSAGRRGGGVSARASRHGSGSQIDTAVGRCFVAPAVRNPRRRVPVNADPRVLICHPAFLDDRARLGSRVSAVMVILLVTKVVSEHRPGKRKIVRRRKAAMRYAHTEIADAEIPPASFPFAQHMLDSYASETNKVHSVWSCFTDADLGYCPRPRASTVGDILKHQLLSERRFFGEFLAAPELPAGDVLPQPLTVTSASARLAELVRHRLPLLATAAAHGASSHAAHGVSQIAGTRRAVHVRPHSGCDLGGSGSDAERSGRIPAMMAPARRYRMARVPWARAMRPVARCPSPASSDTYPAGGTRDSRSGADRARPWRAGPLPDARTPGRTDMSTVPGWDARRCA